jgi:hypothetical protein
MCLVCRVRRIALTESRRKEENKWADPTTKTKLVDWRGGAVEFAKNGNEKLAGPPWFGIKIRHKRVFPSIRSIHHTGEKEYFWWLDYCGPPQLFLTRKAACAEAKKLREQYKGSRVRVVPVGEIANG